VRLPRNINLEKINSAATNKTAISDKDAELKTIWENSDRATTVVLREILKTE